MDLFVYGSLMVPRVMHAVCGHRAAGEPAVLDGYCRRLVRGEVYPAIYACPGEAVSGLLYRGISTAQLLLLDRFEGAMYLRSTVRVSSGGRTRPADAYVIDPAARHLLSDAPWDLDSFLEEGLQRFMGEYRGFPADGCGPP